MSFQLPRHPGMFRSGAEMEFLNAATAEIPPLLERAAQFLGSVPVTLTFAVAIFPVAIAILARQFLASLMALLLSAVAVSVVLAPRLLPTVIAIAAYLGALLVSLAAVVARRRRSLMAAEIDGLKSSLGELMVAEQRRSMTELKSAEPARSEAKVLQ
jgi:hypothetical protein